MKARQGRERPASAISWMRNERKPAATAAARIEGRQMMQHMRTLGRLCLATVVMLAIGVGSAAAASNDQVTAEVKKGTLVVEGTDAGGDRSPPARRGCDDPRGRHAGRHPRLRPRHVHSDRGRGRRRGRPSLIDQTNGVFTDTEATTLSGGHDDDDLLGGAGWRRSWADPATTRSTGTRAPTRPSSAPVTTASRGIRAMAATRSKDSQETIR